MLEYVGNVKTQAEQTFRKRLHSHRRNAGDRLGKIIQIAAPVEDIEMFLLFPVRIHRDRQARTPANHLLKLDFRFHNLETNQVKHLGHIDTRIEHIHRNCYLGVLFRSFEFTYQPVMMFHLIIDKLQ